jgi:hypothetical protein
VFDPATITEDACANGHLDADPIYQVLLTIGQKTATGRLTIADAAGDNHMFFMQGRPVGVQLAEHFHPLGQLLLELGRLNGSTFLRAQRLIAEGGRLPGQVYKEMGVLDEAGLKETLGVQARRKAEHFCRLGSRPFTFCRGLMYLSGFTSTPLDAHAVIFLAVRQQMGEQAREAWLDSVRTEQIRLVVPGNPFDGPKPADHTGLPAALSSYGFGAPEERFLQRLLQGWESVADLADTGTLPRDEMAVLLRYLEVVGRLQRRLPPPPPPLKEPTFEPLDPLSAEEFAVEEVTAPDHQALALAPSPARKAPASVPASVTAVASRLPEVEALRQVAFEPTSDDVFSKPTRPPSLSRLKSITVDRLDAEPALPPERRRPPPRPPTPSPPVAPSSSAPSPSAPSPSAPSSSAPSPSAASSSAASSSAASSATADASSFPQETTAELVFASPAAAGASNPALNEPTPPVPPPLPSVDDVPVVRKKKVKRTEPLPSEVSAVLVSETRREKTVVAALPSIVIEDD